jgi:hypothetical protein
MKTRVHLYLAEFFLKWEMFQRIVVEKIRIHILRYIIFCRKSYHLRDNVEKCGSAGEATDDNIIWRMRFVCCIN